MSSPHHHNKSSPIKSSNLLISSHLKLFGLICRIFDIGTLKRIEQRKANHTGLSSHGLPFFICPHLERKKYNVSRTKCFCAIFLENKFSY